MPKEKPTYYSFYSKVRSFLSKLMRDPISARPDDSLKELGLGRAQLVRELLRLDVLDRKEKITDRTNSDSDRLSYNVSYKVRKKDFERRIKKLYIKYAEKNVNESYDVPSVFSDEEGMIEDIRRNPADRARYDRCGGLRECDCGSCGGDGGGMFGNAGNNGRGAFVTPVFGQIVKQKGPAEVDEDEKKGDRKVKKVYMTESQFSEIMDIFGTQNLADKEIDEATTTSVSDSGVIKGVHAMKYHTKSKIRTGKNIAGGLIFNGGEDPAYDR